MIQSTGARIFVIEDDPVVSAELVERLSRMGLVVVAQTSNSVRIFSDVDLYCPDVILVDLCLTGDPDSAWLAKELCQRYSIPVVCIGSSIDIHKFREAHSRPFEYLQKPFEEREFQLVVQSSLYRSMAEKKLDDTLWQSYRKEAIEHIAAVVAHDLNNLLTVVSINSELLSERPHCSGSERELVANVTKASDRAIKLTQQLFSVSRTRSSQAPTELDSVVSGYREIMQRLVSPKVSISVSLGGSPRKAQASALEIEEILFNLAVYCRNRMANGGTITIETNMLPVVHEFDGRAGVAIEISGVEASNSILEFFRFDPRSDSQRPGAVRISNQGGETKITMIWRAA